MRDELAENYKGTEKHKHTAKLARDMENDYSTDDDAMYSDEMLNEDTFDFDIIDDFGEATYKQPNN